MNDTVAASQEDGMKPKAQKRQAKTQRLRGAAVSKLNKALENLRAVGGHADVTQWLDDQQDAERTSYHMGCRALGLPHDDDDLDADELAQRLADKEEEAAALRAALAEIERQTTGSVRQLAQRALGDLSGLTVGGAVAPHPMTLADEDGMPQGVSVQ